MIGAEKMADGRVPLPARSGYISENRGTFLGKSSLGRVDRHFQHAHFIPIVGVGKRGEYYLVYGDLPRQHSFGTTLRFTGPVSADSRQ